MAQVVLTAASAGLSSFGSAVASTAASTIAGFAASSVSSLIFGPTRRRREGPRLDSFTVQASTEGAAILRTYGRTRLSGQVIWAANFRETVSEDVQGGKGVRPSTQTTTVTYLYSISLAIGLCEGEIARISRVWADGKPFDLSTVNARIYRGTQEQTPDAAIEAIEGMTNSPAFRGLAYVVIEDLPLAEFGNRIPQFSFEVEKPLIDDTRDSLETLASAVTIIPSSGEFVYGTTPVTRSIGPGIHVNENVHHNIGGTDFSGSLDALEFSLTNVDYAALVVAWFGTDLRLGECELLPGVETRDKRNQPYEWSVGSVVRDDAFLISKTDGSPSFGGTPSDVSVLEAIADLATRGMKVMFHPFILMDISPDNSLPDPDNETSLQSGFPWRGRIRPGEINKSEESSAAVAHFFGEAKISDYSIVNNEVVYSGRDENSFRRMILHYAHLCKIANQQNPGSVESFLLGSELRGISTARDENGFYPAIMAWKQLASDVRMILGPDVALSYGADWSEYFGHQPTDASGDRIFHLDPLWADENIDFIGIDYYMPIADWRVGTDHLDATAFAENGPYALSYLMSNIKGGEGYDWFYGDEDDRIAQARTPIRDGQYGEDWVFRYKDLWNWWSNPHHDRPGGVRSDVATAWIPQSKPFRFTEIGCPAIDNGANQPNVFVDPKSSESAFPHFSNGTRDDLAQRRVLEAHALFWRQEENNPISPLYAGPMVDPLRQYIYAWDARPFPDFPARREVWGDTQNWTLGHWLNGRVGRAPLDLLVKALGAEAGFEAIDARGLQGIITGYVLDRPLSPRESIDPLADIFQFDIVESDGRLRFQPRFGFSSFGRQDIVLTPADLVERGSDSTGAGDDSSPFSITTSQSHDLPSAYRLGFIDEGADLTPAIATARDPGLRSIREVLSEAPIVLPIEEAEARARAILADAWIMRERIEFNLSPSMVQLEAGDNITLLTDDLERRYRITSIEDGNSRQIEAVRLAPSVYQAPSGATIFERSAPAPLAIGPLDWLLLDLPNLGVEDNPGAPYFAAFADPWPGGAAVYRHLDEAIGEGADRLTGVSNVAAMIGRLERPFSARPSARWIDQEILVSFPSGHLQSRNMFDVLAGANVIAIEKIDETSLTAGQSDFEIAQFQHAELTGPGLWVLSGLLRGQAGSEAQANIIADAGQRVVVLSPQRSSGVSQIDLSIDEINIAQQFCAGPEPLLPSAPAFTSISFTPRGRNLMPLAPVHLRRVVEYNEGAPIQTIHWIRRTRFEGDNWELEEVALNETAEKYQVRIVSNQQVIRQQTVLSPVYIYTAQMREQDLILSQGVPLTIDVAQISERVGPGFRSQSLSLL